jgi:hypothetical protein
MDEESGFGEYAGRWRGRSRCAIRLADERPATVAHIDPPELRVAFAEHADTPGALADSYGLLRAFHDKDFK